METKIIKQEKNPFLQREELIIEIKSESTPNTSEIIKKIGKDEELIVIKKINTNFGKQSSSVEAVIYNNKEAREKIETIPQKVRKKIEAERKAAEAEAKKKAEAEAKAAKEAEEAAKKAEAENAIETSEEEKVE